LTTCAAKPGRSAAGRRWGAFGVLALGLVAMLAGRAGAAAPAVSLEIRNSGAVPMRCLFQLGHWVTRAVPVLPAGGRVAVVMRRQPEDGALYFLRDDGRRRMMVEMLLCGEDAHWWESRTDISLTPLRDGSTSRLEAGCRSAGPRVVCEAVPAP
jgi:hypothetical protein